MLNSVPNNLVSNDLGRLGPFWNGFDQGYPAGDWYPQPEHGGFYTAIAKGYYKEEGLDVSIQPGGPFAVAAKQVAAGAAEFGIGSSDGILEAIADGQPLIVVAATMQCDPQGIMVRSDSPVNSFVDLDGHTVAVKSGSTWFEYLVKRYQLNRVREIPATYSVTNFVADPQYIQQAYVGALFRSSRRYRDAGATHQ